MAYAGYKDLLKRAASDKVLRYKAFNIAKNPKYDEYQRVLALIFRKFFNKQPSGAAAKSEIIPNQQLADELHKLINKKQKLIKKKFQKRKVYSSFKDNILGACLADM